MKKKKIECVRTFEPGGTALGKKIRELLLHSDSMSEVSELLLYAADRAEHVKRVISPALKKNSFVISDRYYHSTMAYQGYGRKIDLSLIRKIMDIAIMGREPDIVFLLDIPVEEGFKRISSSGRKKDRIEQEAIDFHNRMREGYLKMASENKNFVVVPAMDNIENIHNKIWDEVERCL